MTEQAASEPVDDLDLQIKAEYEKTNDSATLETEPTPEVVAEPQAETQAQAPETTTETTSEYVETDNEKVQARINKKHFEMMEAKREADSLRQRLEEFETKQVQTIATVDTNEPNLESFKEEDYGYDETARLAAYTSALTDHRINKTLSERESLLEQQQSIYNEQQRQKEITDKYLNEAAEYSAENPSYLEDINNLPAFSQDKLDLLRANGGAKLVHYMSKNPDIASQFAQSDFGSAAVQLGALSVKLNTKPTTTNISKAPDPTETIAGSGGAVTKSMDEMTIDEICNM
jgi:hypothetical protein